MLQISDLQRLSLRSASRLDDSSGEETLVGLTFEETLFYLSYLDLLNNRAMMSTRSAQHFLQVDQRHRRAVAATRPDDPSDASITDIVAL